MSARYGRAAAWFTLATAATLVAAVPAGAQAIVRNNDVSVSAFGQFTGNSNGNGIKLHSHNSLGGQAAFRHSYHWWLGVEGAYSYTRFGSRYSSLPPVVQTNLHEFSVSYLVTAPREFSFGLHPFALGGMSALDFAPSLNGGQRKPFQLKPAVNAGVGVDHPILGPRFGVRVQYRALFYKAQDFGDPNLKTNAFRVTSEPAVGFYLKF